MRIAIASDHAAVDLKAELRDYIIELGHDKFCQICRSF